MNNSLPKVLIISSVDPYKGPGIVGLNHYNSFIKGGIETDFLTKYPVEGHPEFLSVYDDKQKKRTESIIIRSLNWIKRHFSNNILYKQVGDYKFFYEKEDAPPVPVQKVLEKITKQYDVIYVMFWQRMLSFATIDALYEKLRCQIHFRCVDFSPMSGGCHFIGECKRYKCGCGFCPGIKSHSPNDFTRSNVEYREIIYKKVKPIVCGNTYMVSFFRESFLLKDYERCEIVYPLIDTETYKPLDIETCRNKYQIPKNKDFLLFFGSQKLDDERKGVSYLLDSLKILYNKLSDEERNRILLVLAGRDIDSIKNELCFDYIYLGYVNGKELPIVYSMSSIYLSPSVNDAGPSMVNQSMSCGTPVVAFDMGTAKDVIKGQGTGYCAKLRDSDDFAKGLKTIIDMPYEEYLNLRKKCRDVALKLTTQKAHVNSFLEIYNKYKF